MSGFGYTGYGEPVALLESTTETATGTGTIVWVAPPCRGAIFSLDVSAAATDTGDTLDVVVQWYSGTEWVDAAAFTQVLGDGGAKTHIAKVTAGTAESMFETGSSLSAGSVRNLIGRHRVKWTIADAGTDDASFTFSVHAIPI